MWITVDVMQAGLQRALKLRRSEEELNVTVLATPDDHSDRLTWTGLRFGFRVLQRWASRGLRDELLRGRDVEVQTALLGDGIRQVVIEVCQEDGILVREAMPS